MKIRTAYFKTPNMEESVNFWGKVLAIEPHKKSEYWSEFKCDNINFGLLKMDGFEVGKDKSNFVPVFEVSEDEFEAVVSRVRSLNPDIIVDLNDHPDGKSYVFADPFGHEFEVTKFSD